MKDQFLNNQEWMKLPMLPVKLYSKTRPKQKNLEKDMYARSIGNDPIKIFQLSSMNKSAFKLEPGCIIKDDTEEYVCMVNTLSGWPRFPIVLARPKRPAKWQIYRLHAFGQNPFYNYGGWFSQPTESIVLQTLQTKNGKHVSFSLIARCLQVESLTIIQLEETVSSLRKKHISLVPGCKIIQQSRTFDCLSVLNTVLPAVPVIIAKEL